MTAPGGEPSPTTSSTHAAPTRVGRAKGLRAFLRRSAAQVRLRHWAHFLVLPIAGADPTLPRALVVLSIVRGIATAFSLLAFGYLLNSLADRHMDLDPEKNPLPRHDVGPQRLAVVVFVALAVVLSALGPWPGLVATLACLLCGWVYSTGPRLKALPVVCSALNVGNFAPLLFVGLARPQPPIALWPVAQCFSMLLLQNQLIHEAADAPEDRNGALRTTFLRLGSTASAVLTALCGVVLSALVGTSGNTTARLFAVLLGVPFVVGFPWALYRLGEHHEVMRWMRLFHRWCALVAGALLYFWFYRWW